MNGNQAEGRYERKPTHQDKVLRGGVIGTVPSVTINVAAIGDDVDIHNHDSRRTQLCLWSL